MNRFWWNFQGSFPNLGREEWAKKLSKYVAPSWGNPIPLIIRYLPISRSIIKGFLRDFQGLVYLLGYNECPKNPLIYITPSWVGNYPPILCPRITKCAISRPIMNQSRPNFLGLVRWPGEEEWSKKKLKYVTPSWGAPAPQILNALYVW